MQKSATDKKLVVKTQNIDRKLKHKPGVNSQSKLNIVHPNSEWWESQGAQKARSGRNQHEQKVNNVSVTTSQQSSSKSNKMISTSPYEQKLTQNPRK